MNYESMSNTTQNPFIAQTANDYDLSYEVVETIYNKYGSTAMFYEMLEEYLKHQTN